MYSGKNYYCKHYYRKVLCVIPKKTLENVITVFLLFYTSQNYLNQKRLLVD